MKVLKYIYWLLFGSKPDSRGVTPVTFEAYENLKPHTPKKKKKFRSLNSGGVKSGKLSKEERK